MVWACLNSKQGNHANNIYFLFSDCNIEGSAGYWAQYKAWICKANIVGDYCDECAAGFSGYPSCKAGAFEKKTL